jgi:hypothetical protein
MLLARSCFLHAHASCTLMLLAHSCFLHAHASCTLMLLARSCFLLNRFNSRPYWYFTLFQERISRQGVKDTCCHSLMMCRAYSGYMSIQTKIQDLQSYLNALYIEHNLSSNSAVLYSVLDEALEQVGLSGWSIGAGRVEWMKHGKGHKSILLMLMVLHNRHMHNESLDTYMECCKLDVDLHHPLHYVLDTSSWGFFRTSHSWWHYHEVTDEWLTHGVVAGNPVKIFDISCPPLDMAGGQRDPPGIFLPVARPPVSQAYVKVNHPAHFFLVSIWSSG